MRVDSGGGGVFASEVIRQELLKAFNNSCLITSEAKTPPPPESTLKTIAFTASSSYASLINLEVESPPIVPGGLPERLEVIQLQD